MEQFPGEQKEQVPVMNLKTNPEATIRAMAEVEGPEWFSVQDAMEKGVSSEGEYATSLPNAIERLDTGAVSMVYGKGGVNRWYVGADGGVSFSESHAESPEYIERARERGFVIAS